MAKAFEFGELRFNRPQHGDRFGMWVLDADRLVLELKNKVGNTQYEIDLERISTSGVMLDVIFQVSKKIWGENNMVDLLKAFDRIFQPQANLCSCGSSNEIKNINEFLRSRIGNQAIS